ncbi:hypothetical protein KI688_009399 [Linnemannia hyalina]|uniref:Thiamine-binding protein domain-containing protein n=1 Tax=Linnemannia hyalina TaxID=64524 RepID=A0A9P7Y0L0_9FUNG|nr:hypothetical protein KI688_009399 [Linnemannia hyalina]
MDSPQQIIQPLAGSSPSAAVLEKATDLAKSVPGTSSLVKNLPGIPRTDPAKEKRSSTSFDQKALDHKIHAQRTTMEGEMGAIMYAVTFCNEALHTMGPRIVSNVRFGTCAENIRLIPLVPPEEK